VTKEGSPGPRASLKGEKVSVSSATPVAESVPANAGFVTERFDLKQLLGEGGMGSVFIAHDRGLRRVVALKRLRAEFEGDRTALRRFVLEAQIGAQLEHPNIVPLYSFERTDAGSPVVAMQLLEGQTMAEYIREAAAAAPKEREARGKFALKERLGTLLGVCDAIHFAHERGVVHRDLKPENVMLGEHREVYVMDWGLARVVGGEEVQGVSNEPVTPDVDVTAVGRATSAGMPVLVSRGTPGPEDADGASLATRQGQVMGTPQYMPPEQAMGRVN
jgi:serine/threonine protein kinase